MTKSFEKQMTPIRNAVANFIDGGKNRSIICLMVNSKEFWALTPVSEPQEKRFKQEERLIRALTADRDLFDAFLRIVKPVERFYRRQARKQNQKT